MGNFLASFAQPTFNAFESTTDCRDSTCCAIQVEEACFDLALDKKLEATQSASVSPGDDVTYTITIYNQGDYYADSILIKDYYNGTDLVNNSGLWVGGDTLLTIADGQLTPDGLAPGGMYSLDITLTIGAMVSADSLVNYAEIASARDASQIDSRDKDSTPDATNNDPGGASNSAADNEILGDGTGAIGDGIASTDEDDHDPQVIYICPDISDIMSSDAAICTGETVASLSATTTSADGEKIAFVYFTSPQTVAADIYTNGTGLDTGTVASTTATITNIAFPANTGTTSEIYYVYAILDPVPNGLTCRPYQEIVVTVNPLPTLVAQTPVACEDASGSGKIDNVDLTALETAIGIPGTLPVGATVAWYEGTGTGGTDITAGAGSVADVTNGEVFTIEYTDGNSCANTTTVTYTINSLPSITLTVSDTTICNGGSATIVIENAENGVFYQLVDNSNNMTMGSAVEGMGADLNINLTGLVDSVVYRIEATNGVGCKVDLVDPAIINVPDCDFGDLPDANITSDNPDYLTTLEDGGPFHYIIPGLKLGALVDGDLNGQANEDAEGDDLDGSDDEDGVSFFSSLNIVPGGIVRLPISVTNSTVTNAHLEAWIDWNGNGVLDDATEKVVDIDESITGFPTYVTINVPTTIANMTPIGVRFRLGYDDNMTPSGKIESGEVEDYLIMIDCATGVCLPISNTIIRGTKD